MCGGARTSAPRQGALFSPGVGLASWRPALWKTYQHCRAPGRACAWRCPARRCGALRGAGARAPAPAAASAPLFLRPASTAARGGGHRVLSVAWIVGSARIQRRGSPWNAQSWFSKLGIPHPARAEREPASPGPGAPRSLRSVRGLQPPGGAEGSLSGLGGWDGGRGDAEVIPLSSLPVISSFPRSILRAPQIPCLNTKVPSIRSSAT